jgi:hypothetical protein
MAPDAEASYEVALRSQRFEPPPYFVDAFLESRVPGMLNWIEEQFGKE